jgi:hypothetical protein
LRAWKCAAEWAAEDFMFVLRRGQHHVRHLPADATHRGVGCEGAKLAAGGQSHEQRASDESKTQHTYAYALEYTMGVDE